MILVSILGDFHSSILPLFYEYRNSISEHIVVSNDAFAALHENKKIISSLEKFSNKYGLKIKTKAYVLQEDSYESINNLITEIEKLSQSQVVYVNANYPRAYQLIKLMGLDMQTQQKEITGRTL